MINELWEKVINALKTEQKKIIKYLITMINSRKKK